MDVSYIFEDLNEPQRDAVAAEPGPLLVLAGAGSGKTRVLTYRVAWLVQAQQCSPLSIMAVTFTNKAAREMRGRIEKLLGFPVGGMWMGTFHGLSHRMLRSHAQDAGLPATFEILDSDDQLRMIRRVLKELNLDEGYWPPRQIQWTINGHKEEGRRPHDLSDSHDPQVQVLHKIYSNYQALCQRFGLVDFAELLLRALELMQNNERIRNTYQDRFRHILVDEFQDTNSIQYRWLKLFADKHKNITVVGDDDQCVYSWRGAQVENLRKFEKDFPGAQTIRLEQNYRSTEIILNAANAVIDQNQGRFGKTLWTEGEKGEPIQLYAAFNEVDEARFVIDRIKSWVGQGNQRSSCAILYRSNAQSRVFEEVLLDVGMPYRVYGGLRFFERAEIKDALAYMRLISNPHSDAAFERVVNVPTRGIGNKTLDQIRARAREKQQSLCNAAVELLQSGLPPRATQSVQRFLQLMDDLRKSAEGHELAEIADLVINRSGLIEHYRKEKGERAEARVENLEELVSAARNFRHDEDDELDELSSFLAHAALEAGEGQAEEWEDCVQLMSLHSAKGLEFPLVFLTGMEEGLFPHQRSMEEPGRLEEERRLCYVGMTRAMQQLVMVYAEVRRLHGREHYTSPSRFLSEIPHEHIQEVRSPMISRAVVRRYDKSDSAGQSVNGIKLGSRVRHNKFGDGTVLNLEGRGESARVQVNFEDVGSKWLVLAYTSLHAI
ncbi:MAG: DNA helicase II [Gammaproteobacteria bacterium]|nr:DNA helicase II [Gammaproteobacteria bacterium]